MYDLFFIFVRFVFPNINSKYSKIDTYVIYNAPNYFLKVGNFRTQMEAEKIKKSIDIDFPTNYIVKELINLPRID